MSVLSFRVCLGLNNRVSPSCLVQDNRSGAFELARAVGVLVLNKGRSIRRCDGLARVGTGAWRDGCETPWGQVFAVRDNVLGEVLEGPDLRPLVSLTCQERVSWTVLEDMLFWSNGQKSGLIEAGEARPWGGKVWPIASQRDAYESPPPGQLLGTHAGRVWIASGSRLRHTAMSGGFHFCHIASASDMPAEITMLRGVQDGFYVGTTEGTWFLSGMDPEEMPKRRVAHEAVIPGTDLACRADAFGRFDPVLAACWMSPRGPRLGLPGGMVVHLTEDRLALDAPASAGASVLHGRRWLTVLRP